MPQSPKAKSLYVHIPFCDGICPYCDFCKVEKSTGFEQDYMSALLSDIEKLKPRAFSTIYVGGGTPTCLDEALFSSLLESLSSLLDSGGEFTVEANPEGLSEEKVDIMASFGVNRVSLGVQSSIEKNLSFLGRRHTFGLVKEKVELLRRKGFNNINLDLMYGLPGETCEEAINDVMGFLSLRPEHISTYSLILEPGTVFAKEGIQEGEEEQVAESYGAITEILNNAGYRRYEVSNFALPGRESRHNLVYWKDEPYVGLGAGASGYEDGIRYKNTFSIPRFISGIRRIEEEEVDSESDRSYYLLTRLRLAEGVSLEDYRSRFGTDLLKDKEEAIKKHLSIGNLALEGGRLFIKEDRMILLDRVLVDLI